MVQVSNYSFKENLINISHYYQIFYILYSYFIFVLFLIRNGEEVTSSARFVIKKEKNRRSLIVKNTTVEDSAEYTCILGSLKTSCKMTVLGEK